MHKEELLVLSPSAARCSTVLSSVWVRMKSISAAWRSSERQLRGESQRGFLLRVSTFAPSFARPMEGGRDAMVDGAWCVSGAGVECAGKWRILLDFGVGITGRVFGFQCQV